MESHGLEDEDDDDDDEDGYDEVIGLTNELVNEVVNELENDVKEEKDVPVEIEDKLVKVDDEKKDSVSAHIN